MRAIHSILSAIVLCSTVPMLAASESLDASLEKAAQELSSLGTKAGVRKITVLDFTDLQGNGNELGRYVAEQISVTVANHANGFAVLNRANLRSVLDEHQLTASGLINPDTAKKFGKFAGVDAIVMGSLTTLGDKLIITAQVVSIETAQVVGGSVTRIDRTKEIDDLLAASADARRAVDSGSPGRDFSARNSFSAFPEVAIELSSVRAVEGEQIIATAKVVNKSKSTPIRVGVNSKRPEAASYLIDENGAIFPLVGLSGIGAPGRGRSLREPWNWHDLMTEDLHFSRGGGRFRESIPLMAEIGPGETVPATMTFDMHGKSVGRVFRLHFELIVVETPKLGTPTMKLRNVILDGISLK